MIGSLLPGFIFPEQQARLLTQHSEESSELSFDNSELNNDDNFSLQNYPMDGHQTVTYG